MLPFSSHSCVARQVGGSNRSEDQRLPIRMSASFFSSDSPFNLNQNCRQLWRRCSTLILFHVITIRKNHPTHQPSYSTAIRGAEGFDLMLYTRDKPEEWHGSDIDIDSNFLFVLLDTRLPRLESVTVPTDSSRKMFSYVSGFFSEGNQRLRDRRSTSISNM